MFIVYDFIFLAFILMYLPLYLFKKKFHKGFLLRMGIMPKKLELCGPIWIHAVSVGEAMAVRGFIETLRKAYPHKRLVISTVTQTGNKVVRSIAHTTDFVTYLPFDFSFVVNNVFARIKPSLVVIVETEIWPNFISCVHAHTIPVIVINARISDKSLKGYRLVGVLLKRVLNKVDMFCAQTESDAQRLSSLGVEKDRIRVTGNMKFDSTRCNNSKEECAVSREKLCPGSEERLFVCGSTHPGEEEIIVSAYKNLLGEFPYLKLLIAPRHPERAQEVANLIRKFGFEPLHMSLVDSHPPLPAGFPKVFVLDTVGQLLRYYGAADIVFVGGSLVKKGGHNILEPAREAKPVIFGPHMFNFRDITELFLERNACIVIRGKESLESAVRDLLRNPQKIEALGKKAQELVMQNQGATLKTLGYIKGIFKNYVTLSS